MGRLVSSENKALLVVALATAWLCLSLPVFAQEAYYYTYALHPALSYFDHPPMVAWLIWAGVSLFGDVEAGIRLGTWLLGMAMVLAGSQLLRAFGVGERGRIAWILAGIGVPALLVVRFFANPDAPLVAFWTLTLVFLWRAREGSGTAWALAGVMAGMALLSKYTAAFLLPSGILVLVLDPRMRRQLASPGPWIGVVIAALVFSPVVLWNSHHGYASFLFQTEGRFEQGGFSLRSSLEVLGTQVLLLNPVLVLLLPMVLAWLWRRARAGDDRALWLLAFGLPLPVYMLGTSLWMQVKPNWFAPGYVALVLGAALWWDEAPWISAHPAWLRAATRAVTVVFCLLPASVLLYFLPAHSGTSWTGWRQVAERAEHWEEVVDAEDDVPGNVFFFGTDYRDSAQLTRSLSLVCEEENIAGHVLEPILSQNVMGERALQFEFWARPADRIGQDAIFVLPRPDDRQGNIRSARQHFSSVEVVERVTVERLGIEVFVADIFVCRGYKGPGIVRDDR